MMLHYIIVYYITCSLAKAQVRLATCRVPRLSLSSRPPRATLV